jgi:hypothetical protein
MSDRITKKGKKEKLPLTKFYFLNIILSASLNLERKKKEN